MPLQNRVRPDGEIVAAPARGTLMGNRGCIHRPDRTLDTSRWRSKMWIACRLEWKGVRRDPMPPGRWTALFFLDEATALAAGHRPCAYCRRDDFNAFAESWRRAAGLVERPRAGAMDAQLHAERVLPRSRTKRTFTAAPGDLPDGAMVRLGDGFGLVTGGRVAPWSFEGYGPARSVGGSVDVLTPPSAVAAIREGYRPVVHPSAGS